MKVGLHSSNRLKIDSIGAVTYEIDPRASGTLFTVAGGAATISLPSFSDIRAGWWCKFVLLADASGDIEVSLNNDTLSTESMIVSVYGGLGDDTLSGTVFSHADRATLTFKNGKALAGDSIECVSLGDRWYCQAFSTDGDAAIEAAG